jgi:transcriptional regulator with XRE-family HTH domain
MDFCGYVEKSMARLKSVLAARRMHYADLARATGMAVGTVENIACGANQSKRGRSKIEAALNVQIWDRSATAMQAPSGDTAQPLQAASKATAEALTRLEEEKSLPAKKTTTDSSHE